MTRPRTPNETPKPKRRQGTMGFDADWLAPAPPLQPSPERITTPPPAPPRKRRETLRNVPAVKEGSSQEAEAGEDGEDSEEQGVPSTR